MNIRQLVVLLLLLVVGVFYFNQPSQPAEPTPGPQSELHKLALQIERDNPNVDVLRIERACMTTPAPDPCPSSQLLLIFTYVDFDAVDPEGHEIINMLTVLNENSKEGDVRIIIAGAAPTIVEKPSGERYKTFILQVELNCPNLTVEELKADGGQCQWRDIPGELQIPLNPEWLWPGRPGDK